MTFLSAHRAFGAGAIAAASLFLYIPTGKPSVPWTTVRGVVAGARFIPPSDSVLSTAAPTTFADARVCLDVNDNGACEQGETATIADEHGAFVLTGPAVHAIVAEIPTAA